METNNVVNFFTMMIVLELMMTVAKPAPHIKIEEKSGFSQQCVSNCAELCVGKLSKTPFCLFKCLFNCKEIPPVPESVRMCIATCAQSTCSKFVGK